MKRRQFIGNVIKTGGGLIIASKFPSVLGTGTSPNNGKLGIALVGLGSYAGGQLAPALQETNHCYLAGIVTGTPAKEQEWAKKYHIPETNIYNYRNFDSIARNKDIDIVYVILPNSMHAEYAIRAAQAGKHVISEKPMANTVEDCQKMIDACKKAGKKLSIGYRLYFDPCSRKMMEFGQHQKYGKLNRLSAGFAFHMHDQNVWRMNKQLAGGGPLVDLGIYCIEGCIYTSGELPTQLSAKITTKNKDFFKQVEGTIEWDMQYPSGLRSHCMTSYEDDSNFLKAEAEKGIFGLSPAFSYRGNKSDPDNPALNLPSVNEQALQMDAFAQCIKQDTPSMVPGEMGMRDVYLIRKIYESAETGKPVDLKDMPKYLYKIP